MLCFDAFSLEGGVLVFDASHKRLRLTRGSSCRRVIFSSDGLTLEHRRSTPELFRWRQHHASPDQRTEGRWSLDLALSGRRQGLLRLQSSGRAVRPIVLREFYKSTGVVLKALCDFLAATPEFQDQLDDPASVARLVQALGPQRIHAAGIVSPLRVGGIDSARMNRELFEEGLARNYPRLFAGHFIEGEPVPTAEQMAERLHGWKRSGSDATLLKIATAIVERQRWTFPQALAHGVERKASAAT